MATGRTLHVRCPTWEQVEQFYTRKLRRGKLLSMKVPFEAAIGSQVTLGLELPNAVTIAIDGTVLKASSIEGDTKTWIEIELLGFNDDVIARIKAMAAGIETPPEATPRPATRAASNGRAQTGNEELPADERQLFQHLTSELRRMRQAAVHEVLGVDTDAAPDAVRAAWMSLVRRHHPDLVARRKAPAITHLAEELTILANRAYDRLRASLVEKGALSVGSVVKAPPGWLVGFDDLASGDRAQPPAKPAPRRGVAAIPAPIGAASAVPVTSPAPGAHGGGEAFETRARTMLAQGEADNAQEVLAAALVVYPRSRPLRSLYYVASAMAAVGKGELMLATSQLETALAHYEQCTEAAVLLEQLKYDPKDQDALRKVFR
jgi:hypothetical protein